MRITFLAMTLVSIGASVVVLTARLASAAPMATPVARPLFDCKTKTSMPCEDCPLQRAWFCNDDLDGIYQGCTPYLEPCGSGFCQRIQVTTGPNCPNP
jgi:hypothetical protein